MFFNFLREKKTDTHSHKWITDEILIEMKRTNQRFALIQKQLMRLEQKVFTEEENTNFYLAEMFDQFSINQNTSDD